MPLQLAAGSAQGSGAGLLQPRTSAASLAADDDDTESILSAPGNVEMPVSAAALGLGSGGVMRSASSFMDPHGAAGNAAGRFRDAGAGLVSRYVAMFEAQQPVISMPGWERRPSGLRGASTDLVLRFLNRHRRRRRQAGPPHEAAAAPVVQPQQPQPYESDDNSGSEEEQEGEQHALHASRDSSPGNSPPGSRRPSPLKFHAAGTASPSRLGNAARAAVAASPPGGGQLELPGLGSRAALLSLGMSPPAIRTSSLPSAQPSIDLDNVRSNLALGAGGALSPVILSPAASGRQRSLEAFTSAELRGARHSRAAGGAAAAAGGQQRARVGPRAARAARRSGATPLQTRPPCYSGFPLASWPFSAPCCRSTAWPQRQQRRRAARGAGVDNKRDASPERPPVHREPSDLHFAADTWLRTLKAGGEDALPAPRARLCCALCRGASCLF